MAGIEQAFKNFIKRVASQEEPTNEMGEQQTGDKTIPIYQNIKPGYDVYESMPTRGGNSFQQELANGGRINYSSGSGLPPVEEDQAEQLFGENIQTVPTGFSFGMNNTTPVYQEGQPPISGGIRDLKNYVNSTMGNMNPQLGYTDTNFGGNISANMNPFTNAPKTYSANAYYGPEQNRYTLGFNNAPTMGAKQLSAGYEGPYGNINLSRSSDPMNRNLMLNLSSSFADGGLTTTTPPDSGPDPQGVESLFKRRYN